MSPDPRFPSGSSRPWRRRSAALLPLIAAVAALAAACVPTTPNGAPPTPSPSATASGAPASPPASPSSSAASSASTTGAAACTTNGLRVGITEAEGGAAAGSNYLLVEFTNTGEAPCTLYGWPGVSLVGQGNGTQLGAPAKRVQSEDRRVVTVQPGKKTTALLRVTDARNYSEVQCGPTTADGFRIYVPDQTAGVYVARKTPACSKDLVTLMDIAPVGTSG